VHGVAFIMFHVTMEKLLNIEQVYPLNSFKSKLKIIGQFGHLLGIVENPRL
jgi:hypothetical protein